MPLIPGRRTSNMRQSVLLGSVELRNSSAEANTRTSSPTDLISLSSDLRIEISSSTTVIRGTFSLSLFFISARAGEIYCTLVVVGDNGLGLAHGVEG